VTGIVLAGGRSTRFGNDKLRQPLRGRPLLLHAVQAAADLCREVIVVVAPDAEAPALPIDVVTPVRIVRDAQPYAGPLAGLAAGLTETDTPLALVVGGDMPDLVHDVLLELILTAGEGEGEFGAAALEVAGEIRPLPCVVPTPSLVAAQFLLREGAGSLRALLAAVEARPVPEARWRAFDPDGASLHDVDEPADLGR